MYSTHWLLVLDFAARSPGEGHGKVALKTQDMLHVRALTPSPVATIARVFEWCVKSNRETVAMRWVTGPRSPALATRKNSRLSRALI
jgi:hypothetical protein